MQSRTKRLLISRLIFLSLGQWSIRPKVLVCLYLSHVYTPWTIDIQWQHLFVYISRPRANILVYKPRLSMRAISIISTLILFFLGRRIAFINFVMISRMSYSSRFSSIYWHLVTAWIQWKLLLFGTHSFFSCRFIRAVAYRWTIHWLLWLSTDKQEDIIILSNFIYNKMLACASLPLLCTCC